MSETGKTLTKRLKCKYQKQTDSRNKKKKKNGKEDKYHFLRTHRAVTEVDKEQEKLI